MCPARRRRVCTYAEKTDCSHFTQTITTAAAASDLA